MKQVPFLMIVACMIPLPLHSKNNTAPHNRTSIFATPLFEHVPNSHRYWHALIHHINNKKAAALELINNPLACSEPVAFLPGDSLDMFLDKLFVHLIANDPQGLSYLGLFESMGVHDHNAFLNVLTPEAVQADLELKKNCANALAQYETTALTDQQRLSYSIISWILEHAIAGQKFLFHEYKLNQMFGVLSDISSTFTRYHRLETAHDAQLYVTRLEKIPQQLHEFMQLLEHQRNNGIVTPVFALEKIINTLKKNNTAQHNRVLFIHSPQRSLFFNCSYR